MKKTTLLFFSLFMALFSFAQETQTLTWVASEAGYENQEALTTETLGEGYTMSFDKGTNSNPPKYYTSGVAARVYKGNVITFSGANIVKIEFTNVNNYQGNMEVETGSFTAESNTKLVWTGKADEVVMTNGGDTNVQLRFTQVAVTYEVGGSEPVDPFANMTVSPAQGEVEALSMIIVNLGEYINIESEDATAEVWKDGEPFVNAVLYTDDSNEEMTIELEDRVTTPGEYEIKLPANTIYFGGQYMDKLPAFSLNYTIVEPKVNPMDVIKITPAEGEVTVLENFTLTFGGLNVTANEDVDITLTKEGSDETVEGGMMCEDGKTIELGLADRVSAPGKYTLNIPAGAITVEGEALEPLSFKYTIKDPNAKEYTIDPEEGKVERLQNFTITFEGYAMIEQGEVDVTLKNTTTNTDYTGSMFDAAGKIYILLQNEATEDGEYVLTIPANTISVGGNPYGELTFNYTIGEPQQGGEDQLLELPAGLTEERWYGEGTFYYYGASGWAPLDLDDEFEYYVAIDGNTVYVKGLDRYNVDAWVKGTLANGIVTFDYQYTGTQQNQDGSDSKFYVIGTQSVSPYGVEPFQFSYDAENGVLKNVAGVDCSVAPDTETGNVYGYYTSIKLSKNAPEPDQLVTLPEGVTAEPYTYAAAEIEFDNNGNLTGQTPFETTAMVAFDGNDVYVQGLSKDYNPEAWLKGTRSGNTVTIPTGQWLGEYDYYGVQNIYVLGYNDNGINDVVMTYNEANGTMETEDWVIVNNKKNSISYFAIYGNIVLTKVVDGISEIADSDNGNAVYFDTMGRRVSANAKGLLLKQVRMSDGSVKTVKVMR